MGIWQNYSCGSHEAAESEAEHVLSEGEKMEGEKITQIYIIIKKYHGIEVPHIIYGIPLIPEA